MPSPTLASSARPDRRTSSCWACRWTNRAWISTLWRASAPANRHGSSIPHRSRTTRPEPASPSASGTTGRPGSRARFLAHRGQRPVSTRGRPGHAVDRAGPGTNPAHLQYLQGAGRRSANRHPGASRTAAGANRQCLRAQTWMVPPLMVETTCRWITSDASRRLLDWQTRELEARQRLARQRLANYPTSGRERSSNLWVTLPPADGAARFRNCSPNAACVSRRRNFCVGSEPAPQALRLCLGPPASQEELDRGLCIILETLAERPAHPGTPCNPRSVHPDSTTPASTCHTTELRRVAIHALAGSEPAPRHASVPAPATTAPACPFSRFPLHMA